jgi:hypothetical protein
LAAFTRPTSAIANSFITEGDAFPLLGRMIGLGFDLRA